MKQNFTIDEIDAAVLLAAHETIDEPKERVIIKDFINSFYSHLQGPYKKSK